MALDVKPAAGAGNCRGGRDSCGYGGCRRTRARRHAAIWRLLAVLPPVMPVRVARRESPVPGVVPTRSPKTNRDVEFRNTSRAGIFPIRRPWLPIRFVYRRTRANRLNLTRSEILCPTHTNTAPNNLVPISVPESRASTVVETLNAMSRLSSGVCLLRCLVGSVVAQQFPRRTGHADRQVMTLRPPLADTKRPRTPGQREP
jgi:hypothetical protein